MNTMVDPELLGLTLALGGTDVARQAPRGANTRLPADRFVTVHSGHGELTDAVSGKTIGTPAVTVDVPRRQIEIRVPHSLWQPTGTQRLAAAAGLWDRANDRYLVPRATADATHPGGAIAGDPAPSAFFDSAFRFHEPFEAPYRDNAQKRAIANHDLSPFFATVDFGKLAAGVTDDSTVPTTGYLTRVYASNFEKAQGRRLPSDPGGPPPGAGTQQGGISTGAGSSSDSRPSLQFGWPCRDDCVPDLAGRLQRYMVYVPEQKAPATGYSSMVWTNGYALRPGDDVAGDRDIYRQFADKAYWLSSIQSRSATELGAVDVVSRGQGRTDAAVPATATQAGVTDGTFSPANPYLREYRHLAAPVSAPREDVLDIRSAGVGSVTVDPVRAGVDCAAKLAVATDGPLTVTLAGCNRTESFTGTDSGGLAKPETYRPTDPIAGIGNPLQGLPLPPEAGNLPQPPLQDLPPVRLPPNQPGRTLLPAAAPRRRRNNRRRTHHCCRSCPGC
jgi:hypothetical protein